MTIHASVGVSHTANRRVRAAVGSSLTAVALVVIWCCRGALEGHLYVSAMGAPDVATAPWFNLALLMLSVGAIFIATAAPSTSPRHRVLAWWPVAGTLCVTAAMFGFASAVTCTPGCPVPLTAGSTPQDFLHVTAAVLGFVGALVAVLQVWSITRSPRARCLCLIVLGVVAICAALGAVASLASWEGDGGWFEFAAMTAAMLWLTGYGIALTRESHRVGASDDRRRPIMPRG
ncbi:hypothetical protein [Okibacterium endophyticum]